MTMMTTVVLHRVGLNVEEEKEKAEKVEEKVEEEEEEEKEVAKNAMDLEEAVGVAVEEQAKEAVGVVSRLELVCQVGLRPLYRQKLLVSSALARAFYTRQPQRSLYHP